MRFIIFVLCLISVLTPKAAYSYDTPCYFGIDSQYIQTHFKQHYGNTFIPKGIPGMNPFIGVNLNQYMSIELGYHRARGVKSTSLNGGDWVAGFQLPNGIAPISFKTSLRVEGPHINLVLNSPLMSEKLQMFAGAGISQTRVTIERKTLQYNVFVGRVNRVLESTRNVRRLILGMNYFLNPDLALRLSTSFLKHDRFHQFTCDSSYPFITQEIKSKNAVIYSIGLRWGF